MKFPPSPHYFEAVTQTLDISFFEDIISYPLSRPEKWYNIISYITAKKRIGYYILYPYLQKFHKINLFFKERIFFGKVTKELFW
jgi:hypothetical protein